MVMIKERNWRKHLTSNSTRTAVLCVLLANRIKTKIDEKPVLHFDLWHCMQSRDEKVSRNVWDGDMNAIFRPEEIWFAAETNTSFPKLEAIQSWSWNWDSHWKEIWKPVETNTIQQFPKLEDTVPDEKLNTSKKWQEREYWTFCQPIQIVGGLLLFGESNASSALDFVKSGQFLSMSVQSVKNRLYPDPKWTITTFSGMRRRNVMNVEICSKKDTLQGILRFIQAVKVCSYVKYVQRLLTERTICTHILANAMKKI